MYDYLIVGAGLFGAVFAHEAKKHGKSCLVVEKRNHIAGNIYCKNVDGIHVHQYGAIFSILLTVKSGIISTSFPSLITTSTHR